MLTLSKLIKKQLNKTKYPINKTNEYKYAN